MKTLHTPGPWVAKWSTRTAAGYEKGWFVSDSREQLFVIDIPDGEQAEANARLIAAAPELLIELKNAQRNLMVALGMLTGKVKKNQIDMELIAQNIARIEELYAKATGEKEGAL